jgi:hypothetical protein
MTRRGMNIVDTRYVGAMTIAKRIAEGISEALQTNI